MLLEAERRCLLGPSCPYENWVVSFGCRIHPCVDMVLLCVEDLCLICALSLHKESGFFWGIWMKVIPDALITLSENLTEKTESPLFSGVFSLFDKRKKETTAGLFRDFSIALFFYSVSLSCVNRNFFCVEGLVDPKLCLKYCLLL